MTENDGNENKKIPSHLLSPITGLIDWIMDKYGQQRGEHTKEYKAVSTAYFRTLEMISGLESDSDLPKADRIELSRLWQAAAEAIRGTDDYSVVFAKAQYWIEPEKWTDDPLIEVGITLKQVEERLKLLAPANRS